jgi:hypothetical protein
MLVLGACCLKMSYAGVPRVPAHHLSVNEKYRLEYTIKENKIWIKIGLPPTYHNIHCISQNLNKIGLTPT